MVYNLTKLVMSKEKLDTKELTFLEEQKLKKELHEQRFKGIESSVIEIKNLCEKLQREKEDFKDSEDMYDFFLNTEEKYENLHDELNDNESRMKQSGQWIEEYQYQLKEEVSELISELKGIKDYE